MQRRIGAWIAAMAMGGAAMAGEPTASRVALARGGGGLLLVPVTLGGLSARFLLDTGTSTSIVGTRLAARLDLEPEGHVRLGSVGRERPVPRAHVGRLCVGRSCARDVRVLIADVESLPAVGVVAGILGADFLTRFDVMVDVEAPALLLAPSGGLARRVRGARVPLSVERSGLSLDARLCDAARVRLRLDSGASGLVLFGWPAEPERGGDAVHIRADGVVSANSVRPACLEVGPMRFDGVQAAVTRAGVEGLDAGGLLPVTLFKRLYVNAAARYAVFDAELVAAAPRSAANVLGGGVVWK